MCFVGLEVYDCVSPCLCTLYFREVLCLVCGGFGGVAVLYVTALHNTKNQYSDM
jgi:hypothetical protein